MINFKSIKWGYALVVSLVLGLSGCYMDGHHAQNVDYSAHHTMKTDATPASSAAKGKTAGKSYASKEPTQKATPGPKQTAAPQLPVIQ